jgi:hypothetical protein
MNSVDRLFRLPFGRPLPSRLPPWPTPVAVVAVATPHFSIIPMIVYQKRQPVRVLKADRRCPSELHLLLSRAPINTRGSVTTIAGVVNGGPASLPRPWIVTKEGRRPSHRSQLHFALGARTVKRHSDR